MPGGELSPLQHRILKALAGLSPPWTLSGGAALIGFHLGWLGGPGRGRALGAGEIKFTGQILPTAKKVKYHLNIKRLIARKLNMVIADGTVEVDGRIIYTANDLRVGLFQSTEGF